MKNNINPGTWALGLCCLLVLSCRPAGQEREAAVTELAPRAEIEPAQREELVKRGKYLVTIMACNDCHSPKVFGPQGPTPDTGRLLSGHPADVALPEVNARQARNWVLFNEHSTAIVGPWGVSFAANLTPDATGIGNWTEAQFERAIRKGKYKGLANGRTLLPPMPWPLYAALSDGDVKAIFAYLKTLKPVKNTTPAPRPPGELH